MGLSNSAWIEYKRTLHDSSAHDLTGISNKALFN